MSVERLGSWTREDGDARAVAVLTDRLGVAADVVRSAPGRVNVIGEHVDYTGGLCLPTALPHRTHVALRRRDDDVVRLVSAQTDETWTAELGDLAPGALSGWGVYVAGVAWALRQAGFTVGGFDAAVDSCVPFGAGLSSSAALEAATAVALVDAFDLDLGSGPGVRNLDDAARAILATACVRAENEIAGANTGGLDQASSLRCVEGAAILLDCRDGAVRPVPFDPLAVGLDLLVIDTRAPHSHVDGEYSARRVATETAAELLGVPDLRAVPFDELDAALARIGDRVIRRRARHCVTEIERVREAVAVLDGGDVAGLGPLMTASHVSLRDDFEVTVPELDTAVDAALAAGALGARMTGGGFGGSAIALVRADEADAVAQAIADAFALRGFAAPAFLTAPPSAPAG
ncbi:galactokinase [Sanguibacter sp. HDW7]|uniref:galactokinase n=1 Tax=Sanguibacter sp. HDW7 TaxID=2714931 RepID=UPI00140DA59C|nr:galactokinase [Sanguibacter sp. HDW7]QIK82505.1 galactokinase [Sanguibacter sp. HDW7]